MTKRLVMTLLLAFGCNVDVDYSFSLRLDGVNATTTPDNTQAFIPADDVGVLEVTGVPIKNGDNDQSVCVGLTTASGTLTCPGNSCLMVFDGRDGSVTDLQQGSHRIFLNIPVGAGTHMTFPIYRSPASPCDEEITGEAYAASCSDLTTARLTGAAHLEARIGPAVDLGTPSEHAD